MRIIFVKAVMVISFERIRINVSIFARCPFPTCAFNALIFRLRCWRASLVARATGTLAHWHALRMPVSRASCSTVLRNWVSVMVQFSRFVFAIRAKVFPARLRVTGPSRFNVLLQCSAVRAFAALITDDDCAHHYVSQ